MPKNDDHSHVSLGPLLDNFKDVKSDPRVKAHDNDSLRLSEEKLRVACTAASKDDGAVEVAAKNLRAAVEKMMPDMRLVIAEAIAKKGRTLEWVRVATTGNVQFSKVCRSAFEYTAKSGSFNSNPHSKSDTDAGRDSHPNPDTDADPNPHPNAHTEADPNLHPNTDPEVYH